MKPRWDLEAQVRVIRNIRDDGTFPGADRGNLLVRRGSIGFVVDYGTFLMDQVIYSVHFLDSGRIVGCREEELIDADAPWVDSRFESREFVQTTRALAIRGEVRVVPGSRGEILKVVRDEPGIVAYHVHFDCLPGNPLLVRESALEPVITVETEHA
jgi:nitrogen fixation protein NifZ